uniref:Uncharacterized protein n=1 Tax=Strigamia maritima TaxID=126957 RepID=T1JK45_STRMM
MYHDSGRNSTGAVLVHVAYFDWTCGAPFTGVLKKNYCDVIDTFIEHYRCNRADDDLYGSCRAADKRHLWMQAALKIIPLKEEQFYFHGTNREFPAFRPTRLVATNKGFFINVATDKLGLVSLIWRHVVWEWSHLAFQGREAGKVFLIGVIYLLNMVESKKPKPETQIGCKQALPENFVYQLKSTSYSCCLFDFAVTFNERIILGYLWDQKYCPLNARFPLGRKCNQPMEILPYSVRTMTKLDVPHETTPWGTPTPESDSKVHKSQNSTFLVSSTTSVNTKVTKVTLEKRQIQLKRHFSIRRRDLSFSGLNAPSVL